MTPDLESGGVPHQSFVFCNDCMLPVVSMVVLLPRIDVTNKRFPNPKIEQVEAWISGRFSTFLHVILQVG